MGGRGSTSRLQPRQSPISIPISTVQAQPVQQPVAPPVQQQQPVQPPQPQSAVQAANNQTFSATDNSPFHDLLGGRAYFQSQQFDIDTRMALQDYLNPNATPGSLYAPSQQLNHAMRTGAQLDANQQFMVDAMKDGMHNLGQNLNLTRYERVDFMQRLGVGNFSNMTIAQLQQKLIGQGYTDNGFVSTSFNDFKNAPPGNNFTDKAVRINFKAPASTQALMPGVGPGGDFGEVVLDSGQHYTITGVRFTGKRGRSGASYYNQVELDVTIG